MENREDDRGKRLAGFLSEIIKPDPAYYDEDELVELFDYASDVNDDYGRMEILFYASRFFPSSTLLNERKAIYYYETGQDDHAAAVVRSLPPDSVMKRILTLVLNPKYNGQYEKYSGEILMQLDMIVDSVNDFADEEVIQLVEGASKLSAYQWLKKRKDEIRAKSSFPQAFLYELAQVAEDMGDFEYAIELIEDLTMLEPFNGDFWIMLAEIYLNRLDDGEKALNTIDYALAIDSDSSKALIFKAQVYYELRMTEADDGSYIERSTELLKQVLKKEPDNVAAIQCLAMVYYAADNTYDARNLLTELWKKHKSDRTTLDYLLMITGGEVKEEVLEEYYFTERDPSADTWNDWAMKYIAEGNYGAAVAVFQTMERHGLLAGKRIDFYIEALFRVGRYTAVISLFERASITTGWMLSACNTKVRLHYIIACLIVRGPKGLMDIIEETIEFTKLVVPEDTLENFLVARGVKTVLEKIRSDIRTKRQVNLDKINPYRVD